ncbi:MAG TPA: GrpB family protein [Candidatus Paceibacterota bacterium]
MDYKIGLKRGTVVLEKHHQEWAEAFGVEKESLKNLLKNSVLDIQHIGSTSIPGLVAKPIIDMLMAVKSLEKVKNIRSLLESAGYEYRENGPNEDQVLFVKGPEELRTHYLHITELNSSVWQNDLAFRDYLRSHPKTVTEYENLKNDLASKYADKRGEYTSGKNTFIKSVLRLAELRRATLIASAGASTRLASSNLSDEEVDAINKSSGQK